jgi:hypothetical protein
MKVSISSDALGIGIGIVYECFEFFHEFGVARPTRPSGFACPEVLVGEHRELSRGAELVVAMEELPNLFYVFWFDDGFPLSQWAGGGL